MTVKYTKQETIAIQVAKDIATGGTIQKTINDGITDLSKLRKGKPLGTVKSGCAVMIRVVETWQGLKLSEQTVKNYATAFRKAYNDNKPFSMNPYRKPVAKGAQTSPKTKGAKVASVAFKGDATEVDIVKGLRNLFNKFKQDDKTASLAMFLLDGLDEYEESKQ